MKTVCILILTEKLEFLKTIRRIELVPLASKSEWYFYAKKMMKYMQIMEARYMDLKNVIIFGDSYSTFEGYIPEGYKPYYSEIERSGTGLTNVTETWWHQVFSETGATLLQNNSWSGSTLCYTGWDFVDCSQTNSFIFRLQQLIDSGFFQTNQVDTVFVFGCTNDSWCDAPLGSLKYSDWNKQDLYAVLPAITYFFNTLRTVLPNATILCMINTELKPEIAEGLKKASMHYGCHAIELSDIHKVSGHPTPKGMTDIKEQVLEYIQKL